MNETNLTTHEIKGTENDNFTFPTDLSTEHDATPEQIAEFMASQPKQGIDILDNKKSKDEDEETIIDEETGEVTTITNSVPAPTIKQNPEGSYACFYLAPCNMNKRINDALSKMIAEGDNELALAMDEGKKTIEGCLRYLNNTLADLGRELKTRGLTAYDDDDIHYVARYYFVNPDVKDVQNVAKAVADRKEKKAKAEKKPKAQPKAEPKQKKTIPLTPQMGSLFNDEDFN